MNWGLDLSPKTDGFMAPASSSPPVDFVCHRARTDRERESDGKKVMGGNREKYGQRGGNKD